MDLYPSTSLNNGVNQQVNTGTILNDLMKTNGMEGARTVLTRPSSRIAVFEANDDVFYIIQTDVSNNKMITRYRFYEEPEPRPEDIFASKTEINELKGEISNVQQSIRELTATIANAFNTKSEPQSRTDFDVQKSVSKSKGNYKPNGYTKNADESNTRS